MIGFLTLGGLGGLGGLGANPLKDAKDAKVKGMEDDEIAGVVEWRFAWTRNWGRGC